MADHLRKQIRTAVTSAVTGLTTTSTRVYQNRVYNVEQQDLPCLLVEQGDEVSTPATLPAPRYFERRMRIRVSGIAEANSALDNTLDQIAKEVEIALAHPVAGLAGLAKVVTLVSTEMELRDGGEKPTGRVTLTYEILYMASEKTPDVAV